MQIIISGRGLALTDAIENYVNKKFGGLEKYFAGIIRADVTVGQETHHHLKGEIFFAECKLEVPGVDSFVKKTGKDLYATIDILKDHLEGELKKHKAKLRSGVKKSKVAGRSNKEYKE